jgi:hypothetical protein
MASQLLPYSISAVLPVHVTGQAAPAPLTKSLCRPEQSSLGDGESCRSLNQDPTQKLENQMWQCFLLHFAIADANTTLLSDSHQVVKKKV